MITLCGTLLRVTCVRSASAGIFDPDVVYECVQTCVGRVLFALQNCVLASQCSLSFCWLVLFGFDMGADLCWQSDLCVAELRVGKCSFC